MNSCLKGIKRGDQTVLTEVGKSAESRCIPCFNRKSILLHHPLTQELILIFDYQARNIQRVFLKTWGQLKNDLSLVSTVV